MPISVDGDGTITGYTPNRPAFAAKVVNPAYSIPQQSFTVVPYETETLDTNNAYSTSNYRFTVPSGEAGQYLIGANIGIDDLNEGNYISFRIRVNGVAQLIANEFNSNSSEITSANLVNVFTLAVGDYVDCDVYTAVTSGGEAVAVNFSTFFGYKLNV